jgi:uncharacterized membrane-anchored protein YitT (DUF2179 family)
MTKSLKIPALARQSAMILIGTAVYAFGLHYFIIPNAFMEGGLTGIALILLYSLNIPPSVTTLVLNLPLFYLGWRHLGKNAMVLTIVGVLALSFCLWIMEMLIYLRLVVPIRIEDPLLATLYAGVTLGSGLGLVFRSGGTTGGTDLVARLGNRFLGWSMGRLLLMIDAAVIASSLFYISLEKVLYTLVIVFIMARMIDFIQEGAYAAKAFMIITDHPEAITAVIDKELGRGATWLQARGAYTRKAKEVVYCVVSKQESRRLQTLVKQVDPKAFIVISEVHDVLGEGFRG